MNNFGDPEFMHRINIKLRWHLRNERIAFDEIKRQWNDRDFNTMSEYDRQEAWDKAKEVLSEQKFFEAAKKIQR